MSLHKIREGRQKYLLYLCLRTPENASFSYLLRAFQRGLCPLDSSLIGNRLPTHVNLTLRAGSQYGRSLDEIAACSQMTEQTLRQQIPQESTHADGRIP